MDNNNNTTNKDVVMFGIHKWISSKVIKFMFAEYDVLLRNIDITLYAAATLYSIISFVWDIRDVNKLPFYIKFCKSGVLVKY